MEFWNLPSFPFVTEIAKSTYFAYHRGSVIVRSWQIMLGTVIREMWSTSREWIKRAQLTTTLWKNKYQYSFVLHLKMPLKSTKLIFGIRYMYPHISILFKAERSKVNKSECIFTTWSMLVNIKSESVRIQIYRVK